MMSRNPVDSFKKAVCKGELNKIIQLSKRIPLRVCDDNDIEYMVQEAINGKQYEMANFLLEDISKKLKK